MPSKLLYLFVLTFLLGIASFVALWLVRHDLVAFEVTILMIDWLALIVGGALLPIVFRRAGRPHHFVEPGRAAACGTESPPDLVGA